MPSSSNADPENAYHELPFATVGSTASTTRMKAIALAEVRTKVIVEKHKFYIGLILTIKHSAATESPPTRAGCSEPDFECPDGVCVQSYAVCDGRYDCYDGSDEYDCGILILFFVFLYILFQRDI